MSSCTRLVSRVASICIRPANRSTASGSSEASMTASESRDSAPVGVLSSWLTLATKSRRTASMRRASVRSSTSSSTSREPSGATRAETARASPRPVPRRGRSSSTWRISPSRRVSLAMFSIGSTASRPPLTSPSAYAAELALTTPSLSSSTTAEELSTDRTVSTPGAGGHCCRAAGRYASASSGRARSSGTPAWRSHRYTARRSLQLRRPPRSRPWLQVMRPGGHSPSHPGASSNTRRPEFTEEQALVHLAGRIRTRTHVTVGAWGSELAPASVKDWRGTSHA